MGSELQYIELSSLVSEKPRNGLYKGKEFQGSGHRWIKMGEVFKNDFFLNQETELLEVSESEIERFSCEPGDLLFGRTSLTLEGVGDCLLIKNITDNPIFESNLFRIRFDRSLASPLFYYYYFKSGYGKQLIQKIAKQTAATSITATDLLNQPVPYFPLSVQNKIADLVHIYDRKIELNRQMNETLESMAQALFKSWFVDFDLVIDNALVAGNPIPDVFAERAEQRREIIANAKKASKAGVSFKVSENNHQSLFSSEFEFTEEMGWIPKGWEVGQLSKHALIEMGQSPKGDTYNSCSDGMPLVNGPVEFGPYFTSKSKWTTSPTKISQKGDLVVCVRGSTTGRFVKSDGQYCLGRGVCSIRAKRSQCFVDHLFKLSIDQLLVLATGSTFPNWSRKTLTDYTVIIPPLPIIDIFDGFVSPKIDRIESGFIESSSLAKIRDALLPKLLSGELRIPGAEKLIDEIKA